MVGFVFQLKILEHLILHFLTFTLHNNYTLNTKFLYTLIPANCLRSKRADCGSDINKSSFKYWLKLKNNHCDLTGKMSRYVAEAITAHASLIQHMFFRQRWMRRASLAFLAVNNSSFSLIYRQLPTGV